MRASRKAKGVNQDDDHVIVGKPNPFAVDVVCKEHGITDRSKCIMIGDNPATDMQFANSSGLDSALVFTGVVKDPEHFL